MSTPTPVDVVVNGLRLRLWRHAGADDTPRVLCIHGALDTGRSFDAIADVIGARADLTCVDLRGHGASEHVGNGGSYHLLDFLKDLGLIVQQHLGGSVDVVVGHSMGGNLALMLVGALPQCTRRLVLVDSVGPPPEDAGEQPERLGELLRSLVEKEKKAFAPAASLDDAVARLQKWNPGLSTAGARRMIEPVLVEREGAFFFPFDARLRGPTPFRWQEEFWSSCCSRFGALTTSSVILRATDGFVPPGDGGAVLGPPFARRAELLRAQVVVVPGGHHLHVEAPEAVANAILG